MNLLAKCIKLRACMLQEWRNKTWNLDSSGARQHLEGGLEKFEPLQKGLGRQQRHSSRRGGGGTLFHMADRIWWVMSSWGENYSGNCQRHAGAQLLDWACCSDWEWRNTEGKNRQKWLPWTWAGGTIWKSCLLGSGVLAKLHRHPRPWWKWREEWEGYQGEKG